MKKIEDIFKDNLFRLFIDYCQKNNIEYLEELSREDFENISQIKGFGTGKLNKLIEKYNEISDENIFEETDSFIDIEEVSMEIDSEYLNFGIEILSVFDGINEKLINQMKEAGFNKLQDLASHINDITEIIKTLGIKKRRNIIFALNSFKGDKKILFKSLFEEIKKNKYYSVVVERTIYLKTLNEIGEERGITRERVRQKEKKINKDLENLLINFIDLEKINKNILKLEELVNLTEFTAIDKEIFKNALKNEAPKNIIYIEGIDKFLINGNIEKIKREIKEKILSFSDIINIKELKTLVKKFNIELEEVDLEKLLIRNGYKRKRNYLIRGMVLKGKIYSTIVKEYFKEGITFSNESDMETFKAILFKEFQMESESDRSIKAIIERNCMACDRGKYISPDYIKVDIVLLDKIKEFILDNPQKTIYTHQIYSEFKEELNKSGIDNRYFLHGLLGHYYRDIFKFSKDTVWKGPKKQSKNYIFNNYVKDKGRVITRAEMEEDLKGWTSIMFTLAIEECREVLKWNRGEYIHFSLLYFSKEEINYLEELVDSILEEREAITSEELYNIIGDYSNLGFKENNVDTGFKLYSILLYFFREKYKLKRPIIERLDHKGQHK